MDLKANDRRTEKVSGSSAHGTPGVEERWNGIRQQWTEIRELLMPSSKEAAVRQLVHEASPERQADPSCYVAAYPRQRTASWAECLTPERYPGVLNLNMGHAGVRQRDVMAAAQRCAGTDVQTHQKTSQDLQQELKLTQAIEIAHSQEQRFKTLLKDLNSSGAELHTSVEQVWHMTLRARPSMRTNIPSTGTRCATGYRRCVADVEADTDRAHSAERRGAVHDRLVASRAVRAATHAQDERRRVR